MEKQLLNRKTYKAIKKSDRQQMEEFVQDILRIGYEDGFKDGFKDGSEAGLKADFKIELVQLLEDIPGIGPKTKEKILQAYKERGNE